MKKLNLLLTLTSLDVLLVTIERFSFTTKILLQPFNFLRLHEVFQILVPILISIIIPFFILRQLSQNFSLLKTKRGIIFASIFIVGIYLYATGNGMHELASFIFNTYCNTRHIQGIFCKGLFLNDYYFGNILYFVGFFLLTVILMLFERENPQANWKGQDFVILFVNAFVYAFTIFAYAAFDVVLVGLIYSIVTGVVAWMILLSNKKAFKSFPYTVYTVISLTIGTLASIIVRFHFR